MFNLKTLVGFDPQKHKVKTELVAGFTTFLAMSYILAVNPDILSNAGMDKGAVFTATALASFVGTLLMALLAKLPFAQAPGMGINAFFAFTLVITLGYSWQTALAAVFVEGLIFILLSIFNVREQIVKSIPLNLQYAISAGIGMFIAFIGLKNAGLIVASPATFVTIGSFTPAAILACIGIIISGVFVVLNIRGALFLGIIITTLIGIPMGVTQIPENFIPVSMPQSLEPTFLQFNFKELLSFDMILIIFTLVFMDIFNTLGTFIGAAAKADMLQPDGSVRNIKPALLADAIATSAGAIFGTSTVTTYVESATGIMEGGRTGLTALTTAGFFLIALFLSPLFLLIPGAALTGALVMVGVFMIDSVARIQLNNPSEALPSFITMLMIVLTYNIAEGIALGLMSYVLIKVLTGKYKEVSLTLYIIFIFLVLHYYL